MAACAGARGWTNLRAMIASSPIGGLAIALAVGLLVGVVSARDPIVEGKPPRAWFFGLAAMVGALAAVAGPVALAAVIAVAALAGWAARRMRPVRGALPGGLFQLALAFLLGALAVAQPTVAAATGAAVGGLLAVRPWLHRVARGALTEQETRDGVLLVAAAAVVLPLLPDRAVDPWQVLNPRKLWWLALIVMTINAAGHFALRAMGARAGLLLTGLAGGFVSSTATTGYGRDTAKKSQ